MPPYLNNLSNIQGIYGELIKGEMLSKIDISIKVLRLLCSKTETCLNLYLCKLILDNMH